MQVKPVAWEVEMAEVQIEEVVDHLSSEFKKTLDDVMQQYAPNASYDRNELFRFFRRRVYRHCNVWEDVPDQFVKI
jgi:hypothetical protein